VKRDHVDDMVAGWQKQHGGGDLERAAVIARVRRLSRLYNHAVEAALAPMGLAGGGFDILSALRRAGPPHRLTPSALVGALLLSGGAITNRLDRLETAGLIERAHDTEDRRVVHITLTAAGRKLADRALEQQIRNADALLASIEGAEVHRINAVLRDLLLLADGSSQ
jgi:DNA-binding MarR family transcriptional regulator